MNIEQMVFSFCYSTCVEIVTNSPVFRYSIIISITAATICQLNWYRIEARAYGLITHWYPLVPSIVWVKDYYSEQRLGNDLPYFRHRRFNFHSLSARVFLSRGMFFPPCRISMSMRSLHVASSLYSTDTERRQSK